MARIVCIAGQSQGSGKSTTAVHLALLSARAGHSTLLVDFDPSCAALRMLGERPRAPHPWPQGDSSISTRSECQRGQPSILGGTILPEQAEGMRHWSDAEVQQFGVAFRQSAQEYDWVYIDCPPTLDRFAEVALAAATEVLLPLRCDAWALQSVPDFVQLLRRQRKRFNREIDFAGVVLTQYDTTHSASATYEAAVREFFGDVLFQTVIPRDASVSNATFAEVPVVDFEPRSRSAWAYIELCMEVLRR